MKSIAAILVLALAFQACAAGKVKKFEKADKSDDSYGASSGGDSYGASSGGDSYGASSGGDSYTHTEVVAVKPDPKTVTVTETCKPAIVAITAEATLTCGDGYDMGKDSYGAASCTKTVCVTPEPVDDSYGSSDSYGSEGGKDSKKGGKDSKKDGKGYYGKAKKAKKEESKDAYGASSGDSYGSSSGDSYGAAATVVAVEAPKPEPKPVCTTVTAAPQPTCAKGATLASGGKICIVGTKTNDCPEGWTAAGGLCSTTKTITVEQPTQYVTVEVAGKGDSYGAAASGDGYGKVSEKADSKGSKKDGKYGKKAKKSKASKESKDSYGSDSSDSYGESSVKACAAPKVAAAAETGAKNGTVAVVAVVATHA